jgi:hypothetical protein
MNQKINQELKENVILISLNNLLKDVKVMEDYYGHML